MYLLCLFLTDCPVTVTEKLMSICHKLMQPTCFKYTANAYCIKTLSVLLKILMDHSIWKWESEKSIRLALP